jgi:hypothetical protein
LSSLEADLRSAQFDVQIVGIGGMQFHSTTVDIDGMAAGGNLPIVEETAQQPVWQEWGAHWRDLYILDRNGHLVTKINLTNFDPSPSVNNGQNYAQLKTLFVHAEAIGVSSKQVNQQYVTALYHDLLHRDAAATELATWTGMLDAGISRVHVALDIEQTTGCLRDEVQSLYAHYLQRRAHPNELAGFTRFLAEGGTLEQVAVDIVGSAEYYRTRGADTNDGYLDALYQDALGRAINPGIRARWDNALHSGTSRQQVAAAVFASTEYQRDLVESFYGQFIHHPPTAATLQHYIRLLHRGARDEAVLADIVASPDYLN